LEQLELILFTDSNCEYLVHDVAYLSKKLLTATSFLIDWMLENETALLNQEKDHDGKTSIVQEGIRQAS
jgi:hypothetical protein